MSEDRKMLPAGQAVPTPEPALGPHGGYPPAQYGSYGSYHQGRSAYGDTLGEGLPIIGSLAPERLLRILTRKWFTLFIGTVFGLSVALFALTRMIPMYRAACLIEMHLRQPRVMAGRGAVADDGATSPLTSFNTRLEKLRGSATRALAGERFRELWTEKYQTQPPESLTSQLRGVAFNVKRSTHLVAVTFEHPDPEFASMAANAFAEAAQQGTAEENKRTSDGAVAWLHEQASAQSVKLASTEQKLIDFRVKNNIDALQGEMNSAEQSRVALHSALVGMEQEGVLTKEILGFLENLKLHPEQAGSFPAGLPREASILSAMDAWRDAGTERISMARRLTESHPDMIVQKEKVENTLKNLNDQIGMVISAVANKLALLERQAEGVRRKADEHNKAISDLEQEVVERTTRLSAMERERDALDMAYKGILSRIEEARLSADESTAMVKIIEPAGTPRSPIWPPRKRIIIMGLILGLVGGFGIAMVTDNLEDRVTGFGDIENYIGVKVLGVIPHVLNAKRGELALGTLNHKFSQLSEAFAGIRTMLNTLQIRATTRCTLVASAAPAEGKTITSCNLAIASAKAGRSTLLVDFDMRRPRLRGIFTEPDKDQSLLHVLNSGDRSRFDALPISTECEHLEIITGLPSDDISPAEILGGDIVSDFFEWAKARYERIVIDSPPYGIVSDVAVLADYVGGVVLVCRPNKSRRRASRHAVRQFTEIGATVLGCVVNDVDFRRTAYFGNYDYRGSYYHYRYGKYKYGKKGSRRRKQTIDE